MIICFENLMLVNLDSQRSTNIAHLKDVFHEEAELPSLVDYTVQAPVWTPGFTSRHHCSLPTVVVLIKDADARTIDISLVTVRCRTSLNWRWLCRISSCLVKTPSNKR